MNKVNALVNGLFALMKKVWTRILLCQTISIRRFIFFSLSKEGFNNKRKQAGAELGQAQDKLKVIVDVGVEVEV